MTHTPVLKLLHPLKIRTNMHMQIENSAHCSRH